MMEKRTLRILAAVMISLLYSMGFAAVFSDDEKETSSVLLQKEEMNLQDTSVLYWLQAGVFQQESSYQELKKTLESKGLTVYCISCHDLIYVLVQPCADESEIKSIQNQLLSDHIETLSKQSNLNESQRNLYLEGSVEQLLKGLIEK